MPGLRLRKSASTSNLEACFTSALQNELLPPPSSTTANPNKNKKRRSKSNKNGRKPARRSVSDDTHETHLIVSIGDFDKELPPKTETEMMADIFKTANELEDLAKKARKARRRKSNHTSGTRQSRRRSSARSNASLSDLPTADMLGSSAEANTPEPDCDERSVGSTRSTFSLSNLFPTKRRGSNESCSRSLTGLMRRGLRRSKSQNKMEDNSTPSDLEDSFDSGEGQPPQQPAQQEQCPCHFQINPDICKPSYYHDSDDDDDDLILDADQDLDEYSKQVQNEVMNMTININWTNPTVQAAS